MIFERTDSDAHFIHDMKTRLTAISGYAQLIDRQMRSHAETTPDQIRYLNQLRSTVRDLIGYIEEIEAHSPGLRESIEQMYQEETRARSEPQLCQSSRDVPD